MRSYSKILIFALLFFTSCKDDEGLPLTPDLITTVKAYDLDNNGNSSDIRVDFIVANNINVTEYRVMVVPSSSISSFNQSIAISIPETNYLEVNPASFNNEYSITRLHSNLFDVNGDQIRNDLPYVVTVLIVGTGNHQLSGFSESITLTEQGIYNGKYIGNADWDFIDFVGTNTTNCVGEGYQNSQGIQILLSEGQQDSYSGAYNSSLSIGPFSFGVDGEISFMISNNIISNFKLNQSVMCYALEVCALCDFNAELCLGIFTGQGIVIDELTLNIDYSGEDCYASWERKLSLTRQ